MSAGRVRSAAAPAAMVATALIALGAAVAVPAAAQPTTPPADEVESAIEVPDPVPGEEVCTITDPRLRELSGMVALDDSYVVINNGGQLWEAQPVFFLDQSCQVVDEVRYPDPGERDPEALAIDREAGILWVGDIGDNPASGTAPGDPRQTVALWRVDLNGDRIPVIHRLAYPDGAHDAEALILDGDGTPIIVTAGPGRVGLYRPAEPMVPNNPHELAVPLEHLGDVTVPDTGAEHPELGVLGAQRITDGANAPDGSRVVLRTYTDAFEFDVTDGDVAGAIIEGTPRVTPLPDEPWGEAITYTPDGGQVLTVSEVVQSEGLEPVILRYTPTEPAPVEPAEDEAGGGEAAPAPARSLLDRLGPQGILNLIAAVGVVGLLMVGAGVFGIVRARRQGAEGPDGPGGPDDGEPDWDGDGVPGPVTARARVAPAPPPTATPIAGESPGPAHGPAAARGTVYGAGAGYQEHPFDQDHPNGFEPYPEPARPHESGNTYRAGTYQSAAHQDDRDVDDGHRAGTYRGGSYHPDPDQAGPYHSGHYQASEPYQAPPDDVPDYYYDDPDYSYEFRDRGY